jgi:hypothetical protein
MLPYVTIIITMTIIIMNQFSSIFHHPRSTIFTDRFRRWLSGCPGPPVGSRVLSRAPDRGSPGTLGHQTAESRKNTKIVNSIQFDSNYLILLNWQKTTWLIQHLPASTPTSCLRDVSGSVCLSHVGRTVFKSMPGTWTIPDKVEPRLRHRLRHFVSFSVWPL